MYYVYILRCLDDSLYTGITTQIKRRFEEHLTKSKKAAQYTRSHGVRQLEGCWICDSRQKASQLEYWLKSLTKSQKEKILKNNAYFKTYLQTKVSVREYIRLSQDELLDKL